MLETVALPDALVALAALSVAALLLAIRWDYQAAVWVLKPLASTVFIGVAMAAGALGSGYGTLILTALMLSWLGDVLLIPHGHGVGFKVGVLSFLLAHVMYLGAFVGLGLDTVSLLAAAAAVAAAAAAIVPRLRDRIPADLRAAVFTYIVVISAMLAAAVSASVSARIPAVFVGALLFYASDLCVARERFVTSAFANQLVGLPLYYAGQLVLAASCAAVLP